MRRGSMEYGTGLIHGDCLLRVMCSDPGFVGKYLMLTQVCFYPFLWLCRTRVSTFMGWGLVEKKKTLESEIGMQ